jgi:hypothetical protein
MTNRHIKDVVPKAWAAARRNTALKRSLSIVNVVTQTVNRPVEPLRDGGCALGYDIGIDARARKVPEIA